MGNKTRDAQSIVGDDLIVTIGSGTVRFVGVGSTNVNIHQGYDITSNSESLQAGSENDVIQNMPSTTYFDSVTVDAGAGDDSIIARGRYYSINAGDGNDSIYFNDLRNSTVLGGNGNDSFYGTPMSNLIFGGAGDDLFSMNSGYAVSIGYADGDGNDSIVNWNSNSVFDITYGYLDSSVQSGSDLLLNIGSSQVTIANTSSINLHQGLIAESAGTSLNGTDSSEFLTDRGYSSVTIDAGAGDDSISIGGSDTSVDGGSGNDLIVVRSSSAVIEFSDGADTLDGFGSGVSIHAADATGSVVGNDYVILSGDNTLTLLDAGASVISGDGYFTYGIETGSGSDSTAGSDSGSTIDNGSSNLVDNESVGTVTVTGSTEYTGSELSNALGIEIASSGSDTYSVAELTSDSISLTLDESGNLVASSGSESTSDSIAQVSLAVDSVTGLLSLSVTGGSNATEDSTLTFKGGTSVSKVVADFSNSSGNFDVNILNVNVADLTFSSDSRISATFDSLNTGAQITLTGGAQDGLPDSGNTFYAVAGSGVSTKSDQAVITITDVSFNATDVLKVDAGIENLTSDFFGNGKFYNYATVSDASTSGVYSSTVLDASDLVENLEMSFSMLRMANGSSSLDDENAVDESNIVNVIWANSGSATIDFSQSQTSEVLIFTDTNGRSADIVSLGGDYNDTIHAGRNDTVDAGGGDDQIYLEGNKVHVIFGSSEGNDTIYGWNSTDYLEFDSIPDLSIVSGDLYLENENGTMLIDGSFTNSTDIKYSDGILRVGNSNGDVIYDRSVNYYAGSNLILDTSRSTSIDLSSSTFENISMIDAANGRGRDVFRYTSDAGNVTISNGDSRDIVDLSSYSIDEISTEFTDSGLIISIDDSSLNIIGTEMTQFSLASGRYTADFNNQTFNS
ncbi:MAG: hypothetical protein IJ575_06205 [Selenomonadaceae bacterium]|nr:hypothetical protein [Selenomonadaceae bacterium]